MTINTPMKDEVSNEARRWADRLMDGDLADTERAAFENWVSANETRKREFLAHTTLFSLVQDLPEETYAEMLSVVTQHVEPRRRQHWIYGLAASIALAIGFTGWFAYRVHEPTTPDVTTAHVPRDITLPDGSVAHLNVRTDLRWIARSDERRVELREGEALFEVVHDPTKPFAVVLDASEIRVLGTRFNVRRRDSAEVVVTVLEGTVQVLGHSQPAWTRTLHANEQLVYNREGVVRDIYAADRDNAARWREGILAFQDEPLSNIVDDLNRYTDRQLVLGDARLGDVRLGGQINVQKSLKASLSLLEELAPISVRENGNTYVLDYQQHPMKEKP